MNTKKIILKSLRVLKYIIALYYIFYTVFIVSLLITFERTNSMSVSAYQVIIFFISFLLFIPSIYLLNFNNKTTKVINIFLLTQSIVNIIGFFLLPFSIRITSLDIKIIIILITSLGFIFIISNSILVNLMVNYYENYDDRDLFKVLYGNVALNDTFSKEETKEHLTYISKQKRIFFLITLLLVTPFPYRNTVLLLIFFVVIYIGIIYFSLKDYKEYKLFKPSKLKLIMVFMILLIVFILHLITKGVDSINHEDLNLFAIATTFPILLHYYNLGRKLSLNLLKHNLDKK